MTTPTTQVDTNSLIGYAVLRANFNANAPSYLDNFSGFVLDVLARHFPSGADESTVAADIRRDFGFTIPDRTVGVLLRRGAKKSLFRAYGDLYSLTEESLAQCKPLKEDIARFQRQQRELNAKYVAFVAERLPEHASVAAADPGEQISAFIRNHTVPLLSQAVRGDEADRPDWRRLEGTEYLAAVFIRHLVDHDNVAFGYLMEAVKGAILVAVLDFKAPDLRQSLDRLTIMLDTPVILKALGYHGVAQREAVRQTLALARALKVKIACFDHTVKEVDGVLESVQGTLKSRGRSQGFRREVDAFFLDSRASAADVEIERSRLRDNLRVLGVRVLPRPDDYYKFGLDEDTLETHLQEIVGYRSDITRRYDVMSLSAVHRQRRGGCPDQFERCGFVLVTDNTQLVFAAKGVDERHNWPLAMTDADLSALLWVRSPATAEDLPRQQLLATVYAGMQPSAHLWGKYLLEIEHLQQDGKVNDDEALILRSRPEARRALMDVTLGAPNEVDTETVESVVDRVREALEAPLREQVRRAETERDEALARVEKAEAEKASVAKAASSSTDELREQIMTLAAANASQRESLLKRAECRAGHIVTVGPALVGVLLLVGAGVQTLAPHAPAWIRILAVVAGVVFLFDQKIERWCGVDWHAGLKPLQRRLTRRLARKYLAQAGLSYQDADFPSM
jgi:hypothetical protein